MGEQRARNTICATPYVAGYIRRLLAREPKAKMSAAASRLRMSAPTLGKLLSGGAIDRRKYETLVEKLAGLFQTEFDAARSGLPNGRVGPVNARGVGRPGGEERAAGHAEPGGERLEEIAERHANDHSRLWDLSAVQFGKRVQAARWYDTELRMVQGQVGALWEVGDAGRLALARLALSVADLTFADRALEGRRDVAVRLGLSILAPLVYVRDDDLAREAKLLSAQLVRVHEGSLWSIVQVPRPKAREVAFVLEAYEASNEFIRRAAGGGNVAKWAESVRHRYGVNLICEARTLMQANRLADAEAKLDSAQQACGRGSSPMVNTYLSHLRYAAGRRDDAVHELEAAKRGFKRIAGEVGDDGVLACEARLFEITGDAEYRPGARRALGRAALRLKYGDTACFDCVSRMLAGRT